MMRAYVVIAMLAPVAVLCSAGCREVKGQCSSRTDTLCLQIDVVDHSAIPDALQLTLSADGMSKPLEFPNVGGTLSQRAFVVEIELAAPIPDKLTITATGHRTDPATQGDAVLASAMLTVTPATAARPTLLHLTASGSGTDDMGTSGDQSGAPDDLLAAPDMRLNHWNPVYTSPKNPLLAISGNTSNGLLLMAVGAGGTVVHGNGTVFATANTGGGNLSGVWVGTSNMAWACDRSGLIFASADSGATWPKAAMAVNQFNGIFGRSNSDIVAVGDSTTTAMHWDGNSWNMFMHGLGTSLYGVWAGPMYFYVAGGNGLGARSMNPELMGSWSLVPSMSTSILRGMSGYSDAFPLAVGDSGHVQYVQSATGQWMNLGFPNSGLSLTAAWSPTTAFAYVVGTKGTVYYYSNGPWTSITNSNLSAWDLTGIWGDGAGGIYVSATNGNDGAIFKY